MSDIPESLLRRSAEAKAKATGRPVEEILAEMKGEAPPEPAEAAPTPTDEPAAAPESVAEKAAAATAQLPDHLLRRSAEAKAKAQGRPVEEVLAELKASGAATPPPLPEKPAPEEAVPAAAPAAQADPEQAAAAAKMPEKLLRRSAEAKAKATGRPVEEILAELKGEAAPAAPAPAAAPAAQAPAAAPAPQPSLPPVPEGVRTQRLLTVVKAKAIQQVKAEPTDKVNVWPHLLAIEFVALLAVTALLVIFSVFQDAPLLELANPNDQPNPSKAPWYFLGLQELLSYFDPQVAGVLIPGLGLAGLAIIPYIDRNPSTRPADRKFAIMLFTFFVVASAILTIIGSFYRGKGFNFTFPWRDGIFFDL